MFSTFILFLLIGLANPATQPVVAEELYHVLFVQGQIVNKTSGAMLQRGDKLKATDKVVFKSKDGKAVVLSNTRGRFVMSANPSTAGSELADVVGNIVSPLKTNSKLSTRGGEVAGEDAVKDLKAHFGLTTDKVVPTFIIIGDDYKFKVDKGAMTLGDNQFIAMKFKTSDGKKGITGLAHEGNATALKKDVLSKKLDVSKIEFIEFYQWNKDATPGSANMLGTKALAAFRPIFVDSKELMANFQAYLKETNMDETLKVYMTGNTEELAKIPKMTDTEKKRELLFYFLCECYAAPSENGEVNVNAVKVDGHALTKWITDNKL